MWMFGLKFNRHRVQEADIFPIHSVGPHRLKGAIMHGYTVTPYHLLLGGRQWYVIS